MTFLDKIIYCLHQESLETFFNDFMLFSAYSIHFPMKKSLSQAHFSLLNISKLFINKKNSDDCFVVNKSIPKVYLFIRMQTFNFYKVCNPWIAVSRACGIILFLAWYFVSKGFLGVPRVKFLKYIRLKVIAIDWFLIYLIRQKEISFSRIRWHNACGNTETRFDMVKL